MGKIDTDAIKRAADILREAGTPLRKKAGTEGGEYCGPCPSCGGADRFIVQPNHPRGPRWMCRQCHTKWGDVIELVQWRDHCSFIEACARLGGERTTMAVAVALSSSLTSERRRPPDSVSEYRDLGPGGPETDPLLFQVLRWEAPVDGERKEIKQRRPDPEHPGEWIYNLHGVTRVLYNYRAMMEAPADSTIYLVEGEKCADALISSDRLATTSPGGAKQWREHYGIEFGGCHVVILPDNDQDGQDYALAAATSIYPTAASVKIVNLPNLLPKGDIYDWLQAGHSLEELDVLVAAAPFWQPTTEPDPQTSTEPRRRRFLTVEELHQQPPPTWLLDHIIPRGSLATMYGPSGSGKTFAALDWGLCVSTGAPWLDHQVDQAGAVIYIAAEGSAGLTQRVSAWQAKRGYERISSFYVLPDAINLLDPKAPGELLADIRLDLPEEAQRPALIIIDTLARCMVGGDENSAKDMGLFIAHADRLRKETGAAVLIIHHTGKSGNGERGSSALRAACDTMIEIDSSDGLISLSCDKQKDAAPFNTFYLSLNTVGDSCILAPAGPRNLAGTQGALTQGQRKTLDALASPTLVGGASFTELRDATGLSAMSLTRHLESLINRQLATVSGPPHSRQRRYHISADGEVIANSNISVTVTNSDSASLTHSNTTLRGVTDVSPVSDSVVSDQSGQSASHDEPLPFGMPPKPAQPCLYCHQNNRQPNLVLKMWICMTPNCKSPAAASSIGRPSVRDTNDSPQLSQ